MSYDHLRHMAVTTKPPPICCSGFLLMRGSQSEEGWLKMSNNSLFLTADEPTGWGALYELYTVGINIYCELQIKKNSVGIEQNKSL